MNIPRLTAMRVVGWSAAGVLVVAGLTGVGVAAAGSSGNAVLNAAAPAPTASPTASPEAGKHADKGDHRGRWGRHGRLAGVAHRSLHGEFVVKDEDGKIVTRLVQHGQVTAVSATSVSLKSEDGFTGTYAVNGQTKVAVGRDSGAISGVKTGDEAWVVATKTGDTATADRLVVKSS